MADGMSPDLKPLVTRLNAILIGDGPRRAARGAPLGQDLSHGSGADPRRAACGMMAACRASPSRPTGSSPRSTPRSATTGASGPTTSSSRARTRRCSPRPGSSAEADRDALLAGLQRVEARARGRGVPVRAGRRRHPHGDRAAADGDRRAGRRQAAHRPQPQRPGRNGHPDVDEGRPAQDFPGSAGAWPSMSTSKLLSISTLSMPGYTHIQRAQPV